MYKIYTTCGKNQIVVNHFGVPLDRESLPKAYSDIAQFDINGLKSVCLRNHVPMVENIDITEIGYWLDTGKYVPARRIPSRYLKEA